jgi:hypothetical protein
VTTNRACCVLTAVVVLAGAPACGGAQVSPASAAAQQTADLQTRLTAGPWRLVDYRPDVALEPMLQGMLAMQIRTMVVRFDGRSLFAQSPTLQVTRPYSLEDVAGLSFTLVSPDIQGGGTVRSRCDMSPDGRRVTFHAETEPWLGSGVIDRE